MVHRRRAVMPSVDLGDREGVAANPATEVVHHRARIVRRQRSRAEQVLARAGGRSLRTNVLVAEPQDVPKLVPKHPDAVERRREVGRVDQDAPPTGRVVREERRRDELAARVDAAHREQHTRVVDARTVVEVLAMAERDAAGLHPVVGRLRHVLADGVVPSRRGERALQDTVRQPSRPSCQRSTLPSRRMPTRPRLMTPPPPGAATPA